jgi:acetyl-CoA carboxylase carboxyl transferase subunit alpha
MLENSIYSILSHEGYASILWKDSTKQKEAAEAMKLTAHDLKDFGIVDGVIKEPVFGAHRDKENTVKIMRKTLENALRLYDHKNAFEIRNERISKFRNTGFFQRFNYENLKGVY